jgi:hypothetical protein
MKKIVEPSEKLNLPSKYGEKRLTSYTNDKLSSLVASKPRSVAQIIKHWIIEDKQNQKKDEDFYVRL